jgi:hypothetical protein
MRGWKSYGLGAKQLRLKEYQRSLITFIESAKGVRPHPGMLTKAFSMIARKHENGSIQAPGRFKMFVNAPQLIIEQS